MNEDKSTRYHRRRRRAVLVSLGTRVALLTGVLLLGLTAALRDLVATTASMLGLGPTLQGAAAAAGVAMTLGVMTEALVLPAVWYGDCRLEQRYGLSRAGLTDWLWGHTKTVLVGLMFWTGIVLVVYELIRRWPASWWGIAAALFAAVLVVVTYVAPVVILPWFHPLRPIRRAALRVRLEALARRADASVVGVYEWRLASRSSRPNAALAGLGRTRRVLLSDRLLADYSDDEIEVVVAHELAHHVHRDIWKTIAYLTVVATSAFAAGHWALTALGPPLGVMEIGDVAGVPILALGAGGLIAVLSPFGNVMSRRHERRADRYALDLTRNPAALLSGLRRVATEHLAEERPSRIVEWLFHSHPPLAERVAAVRATMDEFGFAEERPWPDRRPRVA